FIGGLVIIVRPWKYVNAMADERTVSPKVTKQRQIQNCPGCQASVRFPVNFRGVAKCPRCAYIFEGSSSEE
ncbi:MAG: hypothetical protein CXT71_02840, partial [Methanobacteriota archaeon]